MKYISFFEYTFPKEPMVADTDAFPSHFQYHKTTYHYTRDIQGTCIDLCILCKLFHLVEILGRLELKRKVKYDSLTYFH